MLFDVQPLLFSARLKRQEMEILLGNRCMLNMRSGDLFKKANFDAKRRLALGCERALVFFCACRSLRGGVFSVEFNGGRI